MHNRATTIKLLEGESQQFTIATGIPQGSPLSPILFLFFISDLLDLTNNEALRLSSTGFVDDVNILTYGETTERNCRALERIHRKCEEWAVTHGARFAPEKYELLHLTRAPKRFNLKAVPTLGGVQVETKSSIRVLGVQIDTKLKWGPHIKKIHDRFASQSLALSRITTSTWGARFEKARLVYNSVIKPAIFYGAGVWYSPQGTATARKGVDKKLETLQNQCIRTVLGAYKATSGPILEKEAEIPPITTTLDKLVANAVRRQAITQRGKVVTNLRDKLRRNAIPGRQRRQQQNKPTPGEIKANWLRERIPEELWTKLTVQAVTIDGERSRGPTWKQAIRKMTDKSWDKRWTAYLHQLPDNRSRSPAQEDMERNSSQLHAGLSKPMSSLITQIRTEKIGLNAFLADRHVPNRIPTCGCGWRRQTAKHIIMSCPTYNTLRQRHLDPARDRDYKQMVATNRGAKAAAKLI